MRSIFNLIVIKYIKHIEFIVQQQIRIVHD